MRYDCRIFVSVFLILLSLFMLSACSGSPTTKRKLSERGDDELTQYLTDSGVVIPDDIGMRGVRWIVNELENDPNHPPLVVGYTQFADLFEDIRDVMVGRDTDKS